MKVPSFLLTCFYIYFKLVVCWKMVLMVLMVSCKLEQLQGAWGSLGGTEGMLT